QFSRRVRRDDVDVSKTDGLGQVLEHDPELGQALLATKVHFPDVVVRDPRFGQVAQHAYQLFRGNVGEIPELVQGPVHVEPDHHVAQVRVAQRVNVAVGHADVRAEVREPRVGFVTVRQVHVAVPDELAHARVRYFRKVHVQLSVDLAWREGGLVLLLYLVTHDVARAHHAGDVAIVRKGHSREPELLIIVKVEFARFHFLDFPGLFHFHIVVV
ncbi:hypothetical protein EB093_09855, partial [bacterium]|nr:hypothetical protein [bacterium]